MMIFCGTSGTRYRWYRWYRKKKGLRYSGLSLEKQGFSFGWYRVPQNTDERAIF